MSTLHIVASISEEYPGCVDYHDDATDTFIARGGLADCARALLADGAARDDVMLVRHLDRARSQVIISIGRALRVDAARQAVRAEVKVLDFTSWRARLRPGAAMIKKRPGKRRLAATKAQK